MWLTIRPPDDPFIKVEYYYDYSIRETKEGERPDYYNKDASLRNQKCFIINYRIKIKIPFGGKIKIYFDGHNIYSEWNKSHSKEIKNIGSTPRHYIIESIFNRGINE